MMVKQAYRILEILKENYLNIYNVKVYENIVELEKPIDYLIGNPNKAIRTSFLVKKDETKYVAESIIDILNYVFGGFQTVRIQNTEEYTSNYDKVTCLLIFS